MKNTNKKTTFIKKNWVASIGVFILSQLIFKGFEFINWAPNYREINNGLIKGIMDSTFFKQYLSFYDEPMFNLITLLFIVVCLIPGIVGGCRELFFSLTKHH